MFSQLHIHVFIELKLYTSLILYIVFYKEILNRSFFFVGQVVIKWMYKYNDKDISNYIIVKFLLCEYQQNPKYQ